MKEVLSRMGITAETPLYALNVGQWLELQGLSNPIPQEGTKKEFVFGIRGIQKLFSVSHTTAQAWKNTWLADACEQTGRTIQVDVQKARQLFSERAARRAEL